MDESSRRLNTASMPADRAKKTTTNKQKTKNKNNNNNNKEWESYPNRFQHLYKTPLPEDLGINVQSRMASRQNGFRDQASHPRTQQTARLHSVL